LAEFLQHISREELQSRAAKARTLAKTQAVSHMVQACQALAQKYTGGAA
jgi:hypothetical protein